jgi:hypothetical protein
MAEGGGGVGENGLSDFVDPEGGPERPGLAPRLSVIGYYLSSINQLSSIIYQLLAISHWLCLNLN